MKNKKLILILGIVVAMILIFALIFVVGLKNIDNEIKKAPIKETVIPIIHEVAPKLACEEEWKEYKHDVLGIEFCYPNEWGEPSTDYLKNITSLPNMDKTFDEKNVHYENSLDFLFKENKNLRIRLFNEEFTGRDEKGIEREWDYNESGSTGDVVNLKIHRDICKYKIGYDYPNGYPASFLKEIYSDCEGNVKTTFTENDKGPRYNSYDLRLLSFVKLSNNYFDNALISYKINNAQQINETISDLDEFFSKKKTRHYNSEELEVKSKGQFIEEKDKFKKFIRSIEIFKPVVEERKEFEEILGEEPNITSIRKYYWLIMTGDLESAYEMYGNKENKTLEEFKEMYENVYSTEAFDFTKKENGSYEFYVNYQDHNSQLEKFHVIMNVSGDIVKTVFLEKYLTEIVTFEDTKAYSVKRGDKNYLILNKNGREIIVGEGDAEIKDDGSNRFKVRFFRELKFSPKGNYLSYNAFIDSYVYDIKKEKIVSELSYTTPTAFSFTPDEKFFYKCSSAGHSSGPGGEIYSIPEINVKYDVLKDPRSNDFISVDCSYNEDSNSILFELDDYYPENIPALEAEEKTDSIEYFLETGDVK